jgi:exopolysaccharide production protein ExoZ
LNSSRFCEPQPRFWFYLVIRSIALSGAAAWPRGKVGIRFLGDAGVDVFFVISGFIMLFVNYNHFREPGATQRFFIRRFVRIAPLYWLLTTVAIVLLIASPGLFRFDRALLEPTWVAGSYLFVPVAMKSGLISPIVGVGWTLNFEMYFYVVFSFLLLLPRNVALIGLCAFFCLSAIAGTLVHPLHPWGILMTSGLLLEFLVGVLIAAATKAALLQFTRPSAVVALAVGWLALLLSTIFITPSPSDGLARFFIWGIPAAVIVASAKDLSVGSRPIGKILLLLGDASYSIYLISVFALPASALVLRTLRAQQILSFDAMVIVLIAMSTASGVMCWYLIERPMTSYFTKMTRGRKMRIAVVPSAQ